MTRRSNNLALVALVTAILRLSFPVLAAGIPAMAEAQGWGHSNRLGLPLWLAILILDLALHLQQVLFHAVPGCWRLHRMHHADLDFDATAGLRFHPVEILLPMIFRVAVIGAPAVAVLAFELILNATELFNQSNIAQPRGADRVLRLVLVSPDLHRVHRSTEPRETNSNPGAHFGGGTAPSAATSRNPPRAIRRWGSASMSSARPATSGWTGCRCSPCAARPKAMHSTRVTVIAQTPRRHPTPHRRRLTAGVEPPGPLPEGPAPS